ncbi:2-succinyl-6-hydroxy-2,4-cyclohexadiene-1-carboxylate synthase [Lyngbya confervoides]|uniref:Putative 2-succinyl-6-hydroxy-2,4-cyclohexadiene-1-carboxylate synthase n=1 Tax=Lyngbya confervoides BDU141951 TaxID=1574623 RepID=A0ABD4TA10_9CYAN|nr:2-succinyl-6-hydroxy-2,4-cyclohexadiene-1-carboxylate synthase [Lyngbya confervoides]MCM1985386.1 2-succinyl-6-hydroxy-2,4-cyclohexadiene-1-carboxylate synthase [Lyngbya confervoides BDU141951]
MSSLRGCGDTIIDLEPIHYHIQTWGDRPQTEADPLGQPTVLFLHGFMGCAQDYAAIAAQISRRYYCIAVDLPGHGQTRTAQTHYTLETIAQSLRQLVEQWQVTPCHLVGYSMGGRLALYLALHSPQVWNRVVLESASPGLATAGEQQQRRQRDGLLAERLGAMKSGSGEFAAFLNAWYGQPLFARIQQHQDYAALLLRRRRNCPTELARSLRYLGLGSQPSLWNQLSQCSVPTLLLVGEQDRKFVDINQQMRDRNARFQLAIGPNCGHVVHFEAADFYLASLRQFLP